jgi:hypothetical protein
MTRKVWVHSLKVVLYNSGGAVRFYLPEGRSPIVIDHLTYGDILVVTDLSSKRSVYLYEILSVDIGFGDESHAYPVEVMANQILPPMYMWPID